MAAMVIGYLIGIAIIPKYINQATALKICALLGMVFTLGIVFTDGITSLIFVALLGLANSLVWPAVWPLALEGVGKRSEEHTSELQSRGHLVCRLLLGKKTERANM